MKILICTPCYGGNLSMSYTESLLVQTALAPERLAQLHQYQQIEQSIKAVEDGRTGHSASEKIKYVRESKALLKTLPYYEISHHFLGHESLISRARNTCAKVAFDQKADYLFFIDADSSWKWEDIKRLCDSKSPIVTGLVPFKNYPIQLNFHPFKDDFALIEEHGGKNVKAVKALAAQHQCVELDVQFAGTAFMRIDMKVFEKLIEAGCPSYQNLFNGEVHTFYDFFPVGPDPQGQYFSEDWGFCSLAASVGFPIRVHTGVFVGHVGSHTYQAGFTPKVN